MQRRTKEPWQCNVGYERFLGPEVCSRRLLLFLSGGFACRVAAPASLVLVVSLARSRVRLRARLPFLVLREASLGSRVLGLSCGSGARSCVRAHLCAGAPYACVRCVRKPLPADLLCLISARVQVFFQPEIFNPAISTPLATVVDEAILAAPTDCRRKLYNNIVLAGGSTMFKVRCFARRTACPACRGHPSIASAFLFPWPRARHRPRLLFRPLVCPQSSRRAHMVVAQRWSWWLCCFILPPHTSSALGRSIAL
jgi:hypothetical protein